MFSTPMRPAVRHAALAWGCDVVGLARGLVVRAAGHTPVPAASQARHMSAGLGRVAPGCGWPASVQGHRRAHCSPNVSAIHQCAHRRAVVCSGRVAAPTAAPPSFSVTRGVSSYMAPAAPMHPPARGGALGESDTSGGTVSSAASGTATATHVHRLSPPLPQKLVPSVFVDVYPSGRGVFTMTAPLPGVGVQTITLEATQTVNDVLASVQALLGDPALRVRLRSASGAKLAGRTAVHTFIASPWRLDVGGFVIGAGSARDAVATAFSRSELGEAFERLRTALLALESPRISVPAFEVMCRDALESSPDVDAPDGLGPLHVTGGVSLDSDGGLNRLSSGASGAGGEADELSPEQVRTISRRWKLALEEEGVLLHFSHAVEQQLRHTIFVQPNLTGDVLLALDVGGELLREDIARRRREVAELQESVERMRDLRLPAERGAHRYMNSLCYVATVGMVGQFSWLAHRVYTVSWDVMEPFIYFLDMGYVMLFYLFFLRTSQDPNFDNMFGNAYNWQLQKRLKRAGYDEAEVQRMTEAIADKQQELSVLYSRLGPSSAAVTTTPASGSGKSDPK